MAFDASAQGVVAVFIPPAMREDLDVAGRGDASPISGNIRAAVDRSAIEVTIGAPYRGFKEESDAHHEAD